MSKVKNGLVAAAGLVVGIVTLRAIRNRSGESTEETSESEEMAEAEQAGAGEKVGAAEQVEKPEETMEAAAEDTDELSDPEAVVRTEAEAAAEHLTAAAEHARAAAESALEYARAELEETDQPIASEK